MKNEWGYGYRAYMVICYIHKMTKVTQYFFVYSNDAIKQKLEIRPRKRFFFSFLLNMRRI